jgi:hypothetical protein
MLHFPVLLEESVDFLLHKQYINADDDDGLTVSFEFSEDENSSWLSTH